MVFHTWREKKHNSANINLDLAFEEPCTNCTNYFSSDGRASGPDSDRLETAISAVRRQLLPQTMKANWPHARKHFEVFPPSPPSNINDVSSHKTPRFNYCFIRPQKILNICSGARGSADLSPPLPDRHSMMSMSRWGERILHCEYVYRHRGCASRQMLTFAPLLCLARVYNAPHRIYEASFHENVVSSVATNVFLDNQLKAVPPFLVKLW